MFFKACLITFGSRFHQTCHSRVSDEHPAVAFRGLGDWEQVLEMSAVRDPRSAIGVARAAFWGVAYGGILKVAQSSQKATRIELNAFPCFACIAVLSPNNPVTAACCPSALGKGQPILTTRSRQLTFPVLEDPLWLWGTSEREPYGKCRLEIGHHSKRVVTFIGRGDYASGCTKANIGIDLVLRDGANL